MVKFEYDSLFGCVAWMGKVEKVPQKCVTSAVRKGATLYRRVARSMAPVDTGLLKKGLVLHGEKTRVKSKKVYDIYFNPALNSEFQRPIKHPGEAKGKAKYAYAYYPASMEYGFLTRSKGGGLSYVPGYYFMRNAATSSKEAVEAKIVASLTLALEKEWNK